MEVAPDFREAFDCEELSDARMRWTSEADIKITRDLIRAGQLLKIEVLDHIVIGNPNHISLRSLGYFL